jgi:hypothetical protein
VAKTKRRENYFNNSSIIYEAFTSEPQRVCDVMRPDVQRNSPQVGSLEAQTGKNRVGKIGSSSQDDAKTLI